MYFCSLKIFSQFADGVSLSSDKPHLGWVGLPGPLKAWGPSVKACQFFCTCFDGPGSRQEFHPNKTSFYSLFRKQKMHVLKMNVIQCHLKSLELPQHGSLLRFENCFTMMVQTAFHQTWNCSYDLLNWLLTICFIGVLSRTKQKHRRRFASKPIVCTPAV